MTLIPSDRCISVRCCHWSCLLPFQEAIRRRREEEDRLAQQNEFLNRSVRGSRKLQALESHSTPQSPTGVVNDAYSSADEVDLASPSAAEDDVKTESLHRVIGEYCIQLPACASPKRVLW
jgi:hypothetical protein